MSSRTADNPESGEVRYNPYDLAIRENPYPWYARLREDAPVYHVAEHDFWAISRYDDVFAAVRTPERFSSAEGIAIERTSGIPIMIAMDPPDHTRLRRLVQKEFTPAGVAHWEPRIQSVCDKLIEDLIRANEEGHADLTEVLATPLPVIVIAEILGVPPGEREQFKLWSEQVVYLIGGAIDPALQSTSMTAVIELWTYFDKIITDRRSNPGDDLISLFIRAGENGNADVLSQEEIIAQCILFLIGGNETTTNLIGNTFKLLFTQRDVEEQLRSDPSLIPGALEEVLRWDAPVQGLFRTTMTEVEVAGVKLPEGARVQLLYGSANRDERHYPDAESFNIHRGSRDHLAFGGGAHLCIGAPLARLEAKIAVESLLARTKRMEQVGEAQLNYNLLVRGPRTLPVHFETIH